MREQRFTIQKASGMYLHLPIFDNGVEMADGDVCILLNEQQATIQSLQREIEELGISIKLFEDDVATKDKKIEEQQDTITELKSIINFASNEGDLIVVLMKEIIKLRQEVQECRAYETIEKGVFNYD